MGSEVIVMKGYEFPHYNGCAVAIQNILAGGKYMEVFGKDKEASRLLFVLT